MDPVLPENWGELHSTNVSFNGARLTIDVSADDADVTGVAEDMVFHGSPRPTFDDLLLTFDEDM
jgi:hypothetical protein